MPTLFSFYFRLLVLLTGLVGAGRVWQVTKPGSGAGNQALSSVAGRLAQDVYVWQRIWSSEVWTAVEAQRGLFRRVMPLAAELEIESGKRKSITVDVDWGRLAKLAPQIEPCIRLAAGAVEADEVWLAAVVKKTVSSAARAGVRLAGLQLDCDWPSGKLAHLAGLILAARANAAEIPVMVTALPDWRVPWTNWPSHRFGE